MDPSGPRPLGSPRLHHVTMLPKFRLVANLLANLVTNLTTTSLGLLIAHGRNNSSLRGSLASQSCLSLAIEMLGEYAAGNYPKYVAMRIAN